jgi:hypothetical protein
LHDKKINKHGIYSYGFKACVETLTTHLKNNESFFDINVESKCTVFLSKEEINFTPTYKKFDNTINKLNTKIGFFQKQYQKVIIKIFLFYVFIFR